MSVVDPPRAQELREVLASADDNAVVSLVLPAGFKGDDTVATFCNVHVENRGPVVTILPQPALESASAAVVPRPTPQFSDTVVEQYAFACARAGCFELKARLLADKTPALEAGSLSMDLSKLIPAILENFGNRLTPERRKLLTAIPGLRNKLLHIEFSRLQGRVKPFAETLHDAGVVKLDLRTGDSRTVASTTTKDGGLFGWLLQGATSGAFRVAADVFLQGVHVLDHISAELDRESHDDAG